MDRKLKGFKWDKCTSENCRPTTSEVHSLTQQESVQHLLRGGCVLARSKPEQAAGATRLALNTYIFKGREMVNEQKREAMR